MNNPSNNSRHSDPLNPSKSNISADFFMRQSDRPDLGLPNKPDSKMDLDLNDIFMNNLLRNPGSLNQFFDKGGPNADFFNAAASNGQNLSFDPNLLYNFPNVNTNNKGSTTAGGSDSLNQNSLYLPNMNNNFLLPPNLGLTNPNLYDDIMKNQNPGQIDLNDKNLFNNNLLAENSGLMDNHFLFPGFDDLNFKSQELGQASKGFNQGGNMGGLNNFQNQMLLNNLAFGNDLGLNNFLLPSMPNFNLEELYNMQMSGSAPLGSIPHNLANRPMDLKMENQNQQKFQGGQQNQPARNNPKNNQESAQKPSKPEPQKAQNSYSNQQALAFLDGMQGKSVGMPPNLGMFNFPMQQMMLPKDMDSQANLFKYVTGGMETQKAQESSKTNPQNVSRNQKEPQTTAQPEDPKQNASSLDMMKTGFMNPSELDMLGRGLLDPYMMGGAGLASGKGGFLDSFGLEDPSILETQANLYNKLKEKNRYERSLKIERYKNKKRNWAKKISYDCRKRVADTRLRIKGRFISKKDTEKIQQLVGKQEEAFNEKKNLNLDYLNNKFHIAEDSPSNSGKPNISKVFLLSKIDQILHNNKAPLPAKNIAVNKNLSNIVKKKLLGQSKKIFKLKSRKTGEVLKRDPLIKTTSTQNNKQGLQKNFDKSNNQDYDEMVSNMAQMNPMMAQTQMLANRFKMPYFPNNMEQMDLNGAQELDPSILGNMNMMEAMAYMSMNMGGMGMGLGAYDNRLELQRDDSANDNQRFK